MPKTHISSFIAPTLFARILRDTHFLLKRVGIINNFGHTRNFAFIKHRQKNVRISNEKLYLYSVAERGVRVIKNHFSLGRNFYFQKRAKRSGTMK